MRFEREGEKGILDGADYRCLRDLVVESGLVSKWNRCGIEEGFQIASF